MFLRLETICIVVCLMVISVSAGDLGGGTFTNGVYINKDIGFSIKLPEDWEVVPVDTVQKYIKQRLERIAEIDTIKGRALKEEYEAEEKTFLITLKSRTGEISIRAHNNSSYYFFQKSPSGYQWLEKKVKDGIKDAQDEGVSPLMTIRDIRLSRIDSTVLYSLSLPEGNLYSKVIGNRMITIGITMRTQKDKIAAYSAMKSFKIINSDFQEAWDVHYANMKKIIAARESAGLVEKRSASRFNVFMHADSSETARVHQQARAKKQPFPILAFRYSIDPNFYIGGDMGYVKISDMSKPVKKVLQGLQPGQISEIAKQGKLFVFFERSE